MMKRVLWYIIAFVVVAGCYFCAGGKAYAATDSTGNWTCISVDSDEKTCAVQPKTTGISAVSKGAVVIPKTVKISGVTYKVIRLAGNGWSGNTAVTSLAFAEGSYVKTISMEAFKGCTKMTKVNFANATKLEKIGASAFQGCTGLTTVSNLSATALTKIYESAFYGCKNISSSIGFPATLKTIETNAFRGCSSISGVNGKNAALTTVGANAFYGAGDGGNFWVKNATAYNAVSGSGTLKLNLVAYNYKIQFNGNGFTGGTAVATINMTYGTAVSLPSNTFTKTGYLFGGWNTNASGTGTNYAVGASVKNHTKTGATITYYVKWNPISYSIKFNGNAPTGNTVTGTMANMSMKYGTSKTLSTCGFSCPGYTFLCWNTTAAETGKSYKQSSTVSNLTTTNGGVVNLYAIWGANRYLVTFNANYANASTTVSGIYATYDKTFAVPNIDQERIGYTFSGWKKNVSDTDAAYTPGTYIKNLTTAKDGIVPLYAHWNPISYKIKYMPYEDYNAFDVDPDYTGIPKEQTFTYDKAATLWPSTFSRKGYRFAGWTDKNGKTYADGESVKNLSTKLNDVIILIAKWEPINYELSFNIDNVGNVTGHGPRAIICTYNDSFTIPSYSADEFTRDGYVFDGWTVSVDGSIDISSGESDPDGVIFKPGKTYKFNLSYYEGDSVVLYARWISTHYMLQFSGESSTASKEFTYGEVIEMPGTGNVKAGYTFAGWNTRTDGSGTTFAVGEKIYSTDMEALTMYGVSKDDKFHLTLYPIWKANTYKLTLDYNDSKDNKKTIKVTYDKNYEGLSDISRTGYTFKGWSTSKDKLVQVKPTDIVKITKDTTIYAIWKINSYTVHFDSKGGNVNGKEKFSKSYTYGKQARMVFSGDKLVTPAKKNYAFAGWKYKKNGQEYNLEGATKITGDMNVYATWTNVKNLKVKFNSTKFKSVESGRYDVLVSWSCQGADSFEYRLGSTKAKIKSAAARATTENSLTLRNIGIKVYGLIQVRTVTKDSTGANAKGKWQTLYDLGADKVTIIFNGKGGRFGKKVIYKAKAVRGQSYQSAFADGKLSFKAGKTTIKKPAKPGYKFIGWYVRNNKGKLVKMTTKHKFTKDEVIYAKWKRVKK